MAKLGVAATHLINKAEVGHWVTGWDKGGMAEVGTRESGMAVTYAPH